jgi:protein-S-isoprenylcysteine O-methyltransferase Ste14
MTITVDALLRIITLGLGLYWWFYWRITKISADREKPKKIGEILDKSQSMRRRLLSIGNFILFMQLLGLLLFPLPWQNIIPQGIGFLLVTSGVGIAISARKTLGANWAHAYEYQIKKNQELVTTGIYAYIRHPIYTGLCLAFIGGELVAQSSLAVVGVFLFIVWYRQARREEELLVVYFGNSYKAYMKHTKMFIPYIW